MRFGVVVTGIMNEGPYFLLIQKLNLASGGGNISNFNHNFAMVAS